MMKTRLAKATLLLICIVIIYIIIHLDFAGNSWQKFTKKHTPVLQEFSRAVSTKKAAAVSKRESDLPRQECAPSTARNIFNCSVLDFLAAVDPTARTYDSDLVCDESSQRYDIICRLYLRQIGLERLEGNICTLENSQRVPKIVYFVIFGVYKFKFKHYVSVLAAKKFISPTAIYVIGDQHPTGKWWQETLNRIHGVRFLYRENPKTISGRIPPALHHLSDIVRLQVIYMNGGIYLDADMLITRNLEPLLGYDISLGLIDNSTGMGNAFIVAKRGNSFIHEWYAEYLRYRNNSSDFYWNSLMVPRNIYYSNTSRVNLVSDQVYRPNWMETMLLFNRSDYPWLNNYGVHVWGSARQDPESPADVDTANSTLAQIFRHVLYGDHRIRLPAC
ncbi:hypothetical protein BsWGS_27404 [Bradybaena similaris]